MAEETLEARLLVGCLEAVRQIGGEALVQVVLTQYGRTKFASDTTKPRVPLAHYLRFRDTALEFLQDSFYAASLELGRIQAKALASEHHASLSALSLQFAHAPNRLPILGQAAVLATRGNPGLVKAAMRDPDQLTLTIERCFECRGLKRQKPFCFLHQGLLSAFAESALGLKIRMEETRCLATGGPACEIQLVLDR